MVLMTNILISIFLIFQLPSQFQMNNKKIVYKQYSKIFFSKKDCVDQSIIKINFDREEESKVNYFLLSYCEDDVSDDDLLSAWKVVKIPTLNFIATQVNQVRSDESNRELDEEEMIEKINEIIQLSISSRTISLSKFSFNMKLKSRKNLLRMYPLSDNKFLLLNQSKEKKELFLITGKKSKQINQFYFDQHFLLLNKNKWFLVDNSNQKKSITHKVIHPIQILNEDIIEEGKENLNRLGYLWWKYIHSFQLIKKEKILLVSFLFDGDKSYGMYSLEEKKWLLLPSFFMSEKEVDQMNDQKSNVFFRIAHPSKNLEFLKAYYKIYFNNKKRYQTIPDARSNTQFFSLKIAPKQVKLKLRIYKADERRAEYVRERNINQPNSVKLKIERNKIYFIRLRKGRKNEKKPIYLNVTIVSLFNKIDD